MATPSDEQELCIQKILKTIQERGQALFALISPGGTGKSFFIKKLETFFEKGTTLETIAPTNLTAIAIDGMTIYSFCDWKIDRSKWDLKVQDHDPNLQLVVADEVGLMDAEMLEGLNTVLRRKKRNDAPFGGCSVILVGDFLQLCAIGDTDKRRDKQPTLQLFEAPSWDLFELLEFKTNHRQSGDPHHQERLDRWRVGTVNKEDLHYLRDRTICTGFTNHRQVAVKMAGWCKEEDSLQSFIAAPIKTSVTLFNDLVCQELDFKTKVYIHLHKLSGKPLTDSPTFHVGRGARIIITVKLRISGTNIHNGEIGTVIDFQAVNEPSGYIEINFPRIGRSVRVPRGLPHQSFAFNMDNAYALTIHKAQGKTLQNVILDTSLARVPTDLTEFMKPGAFYTAASRVTKGSNFYITELWHIKTIEELGRLIIPRQDAIAALAAKREI